MPIPINAGPLSQEDLDRLFVDAQKLQESDATHARRIFQRNASGAAQSIVNLALASPVDAVRLRAAIYVSDRVLGRIQDNKPPEVDNDNPFARLAAECVTTLTDDEYAKMRAQVRGGE